MKLYVRMRGGLGNQMFQYAYALALRERYPASEIWMDIREYEHYKRRSFALTDFKLADNTHVFSSGRLRYDLPIKAYHVYQRLYREIRGKSPYGMDPSLARRGLILTGTGCPLPAADLPEETFLYGYFQNAEILLPIRETLREAFSLPDAGSSKVSGLLRCLGDDCAAVSIRLGNDIVQSGWQLCSRDYYRAGIEAIRQTHSINRLLIFSDAPERVAEEKWFEDMGLELCFTTGLSPSEQMELLKNCRHFVISNSTFAWWGAFLGAAKTNGVIVAPKLWQGNLPTDQTKLFFKNMILK